MELYGPPSCVCTIWSLTLLTNLFLFYQRFSVCGGVCLLRVVFRILKDLFSRSRFQLGPRKKKEVGTYQSLVKYSQFVVASRTIPNWFCKVNDGGGSVQKGLALESAQMPRDSDVTGFSITSVTDFSQSKYQQAQNGFNFPSPKK